MATTSVKSTFSLDVETAQRLERLAQAWGVSKSEVLRRAIRNAPATPPAAPHPALALFERLQTDPRRSVAGARERAKRARDERAAASAKSEARSARAQRSKKQ